MKKFLFITLTCMVLVQFVQAQENGNYGATAGSYNLEVNFRPANNFPIQMDHIKGRYFIDQNLAFRLGFEFNVYTESDEMTIGQTTWESKDRTVSFGLSPGIEQHFPVNDKLSPYLGAELSFFTRSTLDKSESSGGDLSKVKNANGINNFGLQLLAGFDFYIYRGLTLGVELGYGFVRTTYKDTESTNINGDTTNSSTVANNQVDFSLRARVNPALRLGWTF